MTVDCRERLAASDGESHLTRLAKRSYPARQFRMDDQVGLRPPDAVFAISAICQRLAAAEIASAEEATVVIQVWADLLAACETLLPSLSEPYLSVSKSLVARTLAKATPAVGRSATTLVSLLSATKPDDVLLLMKVGISEAGKQIESKGRLAGRSELTAGERHPRLAPALHLLRATYRSGTIRVGDLAAAAQLSPTHFDRLFVEAVGCGVRQYVKRLRLNDARVELLRGTSSVKEVAYSVGYKTVSAFCRDFRQTFGVTPTGRQLRLRAAAPGS